MVQGILLELGADATAGVQFNASAQRNDMRNVYIEGNSESGSQVGINLPDNGNYGSLYFQSHGCKVRYCGTGVSLEQANAIDFFACDIDNCNVGLHVGGSDGCTVVNYWGGGIEYCDEVGIYFEDCVNVSVVGTYFESGAAAGSLIIRLGNPAGGRADDVLLAGCYLNSTGSDYGIELNRCNALTISGGVARNAAVATIKNNHATSSWNKNHRTVLTCRDPALWDDTSGVVETTQAQASRGTDQLIIKPNLPTEDPEVSGAEWNDGGALKVSAG